MALEAGANGVETAVKEAIEESVTAGTGEEAALVPKVDVDQEQEEQEQDQDDLGYVFEETTIEIKPITIRLPTPSFSQTLPAGQVPEGTTVSKKSTPPPFPSTFIIHPSPVETIADVRALVAEWVGGYWLGPYSLRLQSSEKAVDGGRGKLLGKGKEGMEVREGEKLSDWLEIGEVFAHLTEEENARKETAGEVEGEKEVVEDMERLLLVQLEPYSEQDARQSFLRLREHILPASESTQSSLPIGINPSPSLFEGIRDGNIWDVELKPASSSSADVNGAKGKKTQGKSKSVIKKDLTKPPVLESSLGEAPFGSWKGWPTTDLSKLPTSTPAPPHQACLRSLLFSPFNPPPSHLRQRGHLIYLTVNTLEGESAMLVCTTRGWHVARTTSPSTVFDPAPRTSPKEISAHSLIDLLHGLSPLFTARIQSNSSPLPTPREPLTFVPLPQHPPVYPWLVTPPTNKALQPDAQKMQLAYAYTGATSVDGLEGARDWNEEIQNVREMPRGSTAERLVRERLLQKTMAEFTAASVRAVICVARGDYPPINPHEDPKAHMHLISNIFITKAVNSVDAYTHLGGDEAAHVSHAKDAAGVRLLNKLDIDNVYLLGHTVVDWQGERWVCQSVLPGIFSRRRDDNEGLEESEKVGVAKVEEKKVESVAGSPEKGKDKEEWVQIDGESKKDAAEDHEHSAGCDHGDAADTENYLIIYGADSEGGMNHLHWDEGMHKVMKKIASAQRLALHKMTSNKGEEYEFWTSVDVKGLRGSDGRRYLLDLPRLSLVDVEWLEQDLGVFPDETGGEASKYPHRAVFLRTELVEAFWEHSLKVWARKLQAESKEKAAEKEKAAAAITEGGEVASSEEVKDPETAPEALTSRNFELRFNADAFVDQARATPAFGEDPIELKEGELPYIPATQTDETDPTIKAVRDASQFLRNVAIPAMLIDVVTSSSFGIMDGASLSKQMHSKGINIRYLGILMQTIEDTMASQNADALGLLKSMKVIVQQEMVFRASKHILRRLMHGLLAEHQICVVSHFLNCLLGSNRQAHPTAEYQALDFMAQTQPAFVSLTPESLRADIVQEIRKRFRWNLDESALTTGLKRPQMLRELATRTAFQLQQRQYDFGAVEADESGSSTNSEEDKENVSPEGGKAKKGKAVKEVDEASKRSSTFESSDIVTLLPVVKSTAPSATIAEEVFQTGHNTINRGNIPVGLELMQEGINFYEQIHQVMHPEVAAACNQYAVLMHTLVRMRQNQIAAEGGEGEQPLNLDLPNAVRLQKQAVMTAERTLGLGHTDTMSYYFNLAMLENLQGNHLAALRYIKHNLALWDVAHGPDHPELANVLTIVAAILQATNQWAPCISVLNEVRDMHTKIFGDHNIILANSLGQLTQAHFLSGDLKRAADCAKEASDIYTAQLGAEDPQAKEAATNAELLAGAVAQRTQQAEVQQQAAAAPAPALNVLQRLQAVRQQGLINGQRRRVDQNGQTSAGESSAAAAAAAAAALPEGVVQAMQAAANGIDPRTGEKGHMDVDALVKYIQGGGAAGGSGAKPRGKNALRGKKRTGSKR